LPLQTEGCSANFIIYVNLGGSEKWASFSPLLLLNNKGKWIDSDLQGGVPSGGSAYFNESGVQVFNLTDFKGRGLTPYKVGKKGQGRFVNSPVPLARKDFDWELTALK
jgi:hypothetical protein